MEELPNDDDIDLEALQAQIDISLAHTKNLVSSWLKPAYGSLASSSRRAEQDAEIETLLRRPPRLGVGAPIPASTSIYAVESVKLKNKLAGKKRQRDSEDASASATVEAEEDDDEGRGRITKKKAKVDPFDGTHGKKKRKQRVEAQEAETQEAPATLGSPLLLSQTTELPLATPQDTPSKLESSAQQPVSERKKKRKKKKHGPVDSDTLPTLPLPSPLKLPSTPVSPSLVSLKKPSEESTPSSPRKQSVSPAKSHLSVFSPDPSSVLNLDGPPPVDADGEPPSASKKKRRRRKKKKANAEKAAEAQEEEDS